MSAPGAVSARRLPEFTLSVPCPSCNASHDDPPLYALDYFNPDRLFFVCPNSGERVEVPGSAPEEEP